MCVAVVPVDLLRPFQTEESTLWTNGHIVRLNAFGSGPRLHGFEWDIIAIRVRRHPSGFSDLAGAWCRNVTRAIVVEKFHGLALWDTSTQSYNLIVDCCRWDWLHRQQATNVVGGAQRAKSCCQLNDVLELMALW